MHRNPERSGGSSCSVHGLEGSPWTKTTNVSFLGKVPSLACTTTPCPTAGWPPVTKISKGIPMRRAKNLRKQKAIERAISNDEKQTDKIAKNKDKLSRILSAKSLYD
ncbi:unnamed protein product [Spirodela intermedia]|uniref:Uncharacterized protein n=1 Tax=Spirodela intermedia TaxID=51605 RepID=A0A7I8JBT3_SPIIN|nr:unnamed protein product [Spirodela intermedia]CAA6667554.1 unnamed protein product [Spirodela intermedia]